MDYAGVSNKIAYNYVNKFPSGFILDDGFVSRKGAWRDRRIVIVIGYNSNYNTMEFRPGIVIVKG